MTLKQYEKKRNVNKLIEKAKDFLRKNPRDFAHDLYHHQLVWKLAKKIVSKEKLNVDINALEISVWWHDVCIGKRKEPSILNVKETVAYLKKELEKSNFNKDFIDTVINSVLHHEFGDKPATIVGKVLQDADKLEVFSRNRILYCVNAMKKGEIDKKLLTLYIKTSKEWIKIARKRFHFGYSKRLFDKRIKGLASDKKLNNLLMLNIGLNYNS